MTTNNDDASFVAPSRPRVWTVFLVFEIAQVLNIMVVAIVLVGYALIANEGAFTAYHIEAAAMSLP